MTRTHVEGRSKPTFGLVLDIDGVFIRDGIPIKESFDALRLILKHEIPFIFVTNGGGDLEAKRLAFMQELFQEAWGDYVLQKEQIVLAHTPMAALADIGGECHGKRVLCLSRDRDRGLSILESYGFQSENLIHVDDLAEQHPFALPYQYAATEKTQHMHHDRTKNPLVVDAVVAIDLVEDWHVTLQLLLDVLMHDGAVVPPNTQKSDDDEQHRVKLFFSNPDMVYAGQMNNRLTQGAFVECLRHLYGTLTNGKELDVAWYGKPLASTYHYTRERFGILANGKQINTVYGIGDNPKSDIRGANNAKSLKDGLEWRSVLVRTGCFPAHLENDEEDPADMVENNILTAIREILKREGLE